MSQDKSFFFVSRISGTCYSKEKLINTQRRERIGSKGRSSAKAVARYQTGMPSTRKTNGMKD